MRSSISEEVGGGSSCFTCHSFHKCLLFWEEKKCPGCSQNCWTILLGKRARFLPWIFQSCKASFIKHCSSPGHDIFLPPKLTKNGKCHINYTLELPGTVQSNCLNFLYSIPCPFTPFQEYCISHILLIPNAGCFCILILMTSWILEPGLETCLR